MAALEQVLQGVSGAVEGEDAVDDGADAGAVVEGDHLLEAVARRGPLVIVVEDIHWAQPTLLELLEHVATFAAGAPLLLVCLTRPELLEERSSWTGVGGERSVVIPLSPLAPTEARALLERIERGADLTADERQRLLEAAEGNPVADGLGPRAGFPTGAELIDRYAGRSDVDVGPLHWHVALGCFKLAVICEGIHYRHTQGQTLGEGFDRIGDMVAPLVAHGLTAVEEK